MQAGGTVMIVLGVISVLTGIAVLAVGTGSPGGGGSGSSGGSSGGGFTTTGPNCMVGKRCGNTCISVDKTCHIDDYNGGSYTPSGPVRPAFISGGTVMLLGGIGSIIGGGVMLFRAPQPAMVLLSPGGVVVHF